MYQSVQQYLEVMYDDTVQIFTDASKEPAGKTGVAVYIPKYNVTIQKRTSNHLSIFSAEMMAIILALQWVEEVKPYKSVICSDSMSSLTSIQTGKSACRQDLLDEVHQMIFRITQQKLVLHFTWVPAHTGIEGNEKADELAKEALKAEQEVQVPLSKSEFKTIIKHGIHKLWQDKWDKGEKGRHLYSIQQTVTVKKISSLSRQEETWFTRLRLGHTGLNSGLHIMGKHETGMCPYCTETETVKHVLLTCRQYSEEREIIKRVTKNSVTLSNLLSLPGTQSTTKAVIEFLKETQLARRL